MDMTKKDGGVITEWTLNTLSVAPKEINDFADMGVRTDKCYILSGYIKEDPTGRFEVGFHFRSSIVIDIDEDKGLVETQNTIYRLDGPADQGIADMGDLIMKVTY